MSKHIIDIKAESLPWQVKFMGVLFLLGGFSILGNLWWLSIVFVLIGLLLLTAFSGTEIDTENKTLREYNSYLFFRSGAIEKYNAVEQVFINGAKVSQKMFTAHTNSSSTFTHEVFNAYLKFDSGKVIFLTSHKNKAQLLKILQPLINFSVLGLKDNTLPN